MNRDNSVMYENRIDSLIEENNKLLDEIKELKRQIAPDDYVYCDYCYEYKPETIELGQWGGETSSKCATCRPDINKRLDLKYRQMIESE